jgi:nitrite reductase/ring-hydroxylating ferredoxin subunit/DMSO/TMAO reductase YedYZ heme-binding membrane subunit
MRDILTRHQVNLSLVLTLGYVLFWPVFSDNLIWPAAALLGVVALLALTRRSWVDIGLAALVGGTFVWARLGEAGRDASLLIYWSALLAFCLLQVTLLIGPWTRFLPAWIGFYKHRRHIGVTTFLLALLHARLVLAEIFDMDVMAATEIGFILFGSMALTLMMWLAATSWNYLQKHVSNFWWGIVHLVVVLGMTLSVSRIWTSDMLADWQRYAAVGFFVYAILVAPWGLGYFNLKPRSGWKQLHFLIYAAYGAVLIHSWEAYFSYAREPYRSLFVYLSALTILSHGLGWVRRGRQWLSDRRARGAVIDIDGKAYHLADAVAAFEPGRGRRFVLGGEQVAVFLHEGDFFAIGNRCPHQGGPLHQGKIENGYVVCPWHNWEYSVKDGCGPPGYADCVPYFPVAVRDGRVYVALTPVPRKASTT